MAKVTAPLLSLGGSGTIGGTVTFAKWRGVPYARQRVTPANPQTTAQQQTRNTFAMLREFWKRLEADGRNPWDAFATGRKFIGLNAFVGENIRLILGDADMNNFEGSPGANGGFGLTSVSAAQGGGSGELDVTIVPPSLPTGWSVTECVAMAFPDQAADAVFGGPIAIDTDNSDPYVITLTGLGSNVACQAVGWAVYEKPNGEAAYSPSIIDQANSGV